MRIKLFVVAVFVFVLSFSVCSEIYAQKPRARLPFVIYVESSSRENHFAPSGWMGDFGDLKINPANAESPHSGNTCIKIAYSGRMAQGAGWAGIYWQQPANNWGDKRGAGYNLTGAEKLTFWVRGQKGGEKIAEFKVGGITGEYPDSCTAAIGPITLSKEWTKYSIPLDEKDMSSIIGGFCFALSKDDNPTGAVIFFDDIAYE
ncbi:MAG: hypothetical protein LBU55_00340 [Elusimicrobiota bacterium]|jgi:hypothetical protein|nr:hypothetical protein [Elusimicrobiota bacterium]